MCYFSIEILNFIYILTSFADSLFTPTETWANSDIEDVKKGNLWAYEFQACGAGVKLFPLVTEYASSMYLSTM